MNKRKYSSKTKIFLKKLDNLSIDPPNYGEKGVKINKKCCIFFCEFPIYVLVYNNLNP